jgi:hypothetical protein
MSETSDLLLSCSGPVKGSVIDDRPAFDTVPAAGDRGYTIYTRASVVDDDQLVAQLGGG